jgi:hypothetical protein
LILKTAAVPSVNTIPNFILSCAPNQYTSVTCNSNCVSFSRMEYIGVSYNVVGCVLLMLGGSSYMFCPDVVTVYGVGSFLYTCTVDGDVCAVV